MIYSTRYDDIIGIHWIKCGGIIKSNLLFPLLLEIFSNSNLSYSKLFLLDMSKLIINSGYIDDAVQTKYKIKLNKYHDLDIAVYYKNNRNEQNIYKKIGLDAFFNFKTFNNPDDSIKWLNNYRRQ